MKIIFPSIGFNLKGGNLYNDLVDSILERGHEIVICRSEDKIKETSLEKINNRFEVLHIKTGNQFEKNPVKKGINMIMLSRYFIKAIKKNLSNYKFDLVLYATPPISLNAVVEFCKNEYKAKTFLMLKDIFPQNAADLNMIKENSIIYNFFRQKEKSLYELSDYIGCMSEKNKEYLLSHNEIPKEKVHIFYNSIKIKNIEIKKEPKEYIDILFGGNLGKPQYIDGVLKIIDRLKDYEKIKFTIIGKGTEAFKVKKYIEEKKPKNLIFYDYLEKNEYEKKLMKTDIGLISLDYRFTIPNIPSKMLSYMEMKKPIIAITDENTDLKEMIESADCGWWLKSNDTEIVVETIKKISDMQDLEKKGLNGYKYLKKYFDVEINVKQIEEFMEE